MNLDELVIPENLKIPNCEKQVIAFEGVDACGKSTLCLELSEKYNNFEFIKIPKAYISMPFKEYLSFHASRIGNALIYMSSLIDRKNMILSLSSEVEYVVMDRSLWSTIAINYAKYPEQTQDIINVFSTLDKYIPIPSVVYVLDVPYEICRKRVSERAKEEQIFDWMPKEEYQRHIDFYRWLERQNVGVKIIKQDFTNSIDEEVIFIHDDVIGDTHQ